MNRAGQPQQRGPSLATTPGLANQFRPPFPNYGLPSRNASVLQATGYVPAPQPNTHRTVTQQQVQGMTPQPTPGFMQTRAQNNYAFGAGPLGQHQASVGLQQPPLSSQQQQQTNGTSSSMPPHLTQSSVIGTPSISSTSDVALDPKDFPALGSTSTNNTTSSTPANVSHATSYASHAGTGPSLGGSGNSANAGTIGGGSGNQPRDFTDNDFPALGGQSHSTQNQSSVNSHNAGQDSIPHPPGLNGFQQEFQSRSRGLTGDLTSSALQAPGLLNLQPTRNIHPGFQQGQNESEKQQRNGASQGSHLGHPPGVTPSTASYAQQPADVPGANGSSHPHSSSGAVTNSDPSSHPQHPQTPAQQVLVSAADRWGLLSLVALMKSANTELDHGLSSIGTDLGTMGLDMSFPGNLYSTFITPWSDQSAALQVEPDFQLPACYLSVHAPPPGPVKAQLFSDETLFFMFYSSPRDALQEIAAQELWNRNWRWHKDLRLWITKEGGTAPSQKVQGGEQGLYTIWDPENWAKERKEMTVLYSDLEEKSNPAFLHAPGLVLAGAMGQGQTGSQPHTPAAQLATQLPNQVQSSQRGSFPMGVAGLPGSQVEADGARLGIGFYCLGILDLVGALQNERESDRARWTEWLWGQQTQGECGSGFRPSPFMTPEHPDDVKIECTKYDSPHVIMTYTALLSLAMLRDDFSRLNRAGIVALLHSCQREDGSFSTVPGDGESDLRTLYCAFAISSMLNDWSGIDIDRALRFVRSCRTYEGGYGQSSFCEAHGGITYIALAAMQLAPSHIGEKHCLTPTERQQTIRWLLSNQSHSGGFCGRTCKEADTCYCFWCGAALRILDAGDLVDTRAMANFLASCQFKYGGISKMPTETPDPYHTYLSLAAIALYSPLPEQHDDADINSWRIEPLDPLLNANLSTAAWARENIPAPSQ